MIEYPVTAICDGPNNLDKNTCTARTSALIMKHYPESQQYQMTFCVDEGWGFRGSLYRITFCPECLKLYDAMHEKLFGKPRG